MQRLGRGLQENVGELGAPADGALQALSLLARLKRTPRTGWVDAGVAHPESIADHCQRAAMVALLVAAADPALDRARLVQLALVHDAGEALVGDVTPHDTHVSADAKSAAETAAFRTFDALIGGGGSGSGTLGELWHEFEEGTSAEADVARQIDRFEMVLSAAEYERSQPGLDLTPFFASVERGVFKHPLLARWAAQIVAQRPKK